MLGIIGTLLGTILGWVLGIISSCAGRLIIQYDYAYLNYGDMRLLNGCEDAIICFETIIRITNTKSNSIGLNNCKIILICNKRRIDLQSNVLTISKPKNKSEFNKFLNIQSHTTIEAAYYWEYIPLFPDIYRDIQMHGCKIYFQFKKNGKNKEYKRLIYKQNSKF